MGGSTLDMRHFCGNRAWITFLQGRNQEKVMKNAIAYVDRSIFTSPVWNSSANLSPEVLCLQIYRESSSVHPVSGVGCAVN
jgi:hypothetical protein